MKLFILVTFMVTSLQAFADKEVTYQLITETTYFCKTKKSYGDIDKFTLSTKRTYTELSDGSSQSSDEAKIKTSPWQGLRVDKDGFQKVETMGNEDLLMVQSSLFDNFIEVYNLGIMLHGSPKYPRARVTLTWNDHRAADGRYFRCSKKEETTIPIQ